MQSSSPTPWQTCYYPVPKRFCTPHPHLLCNHSSHLQFPLTLQLHKKPIFTATNRCTKEQDHRKNPNNTQYHHPQKNLSFPQELGSSAESRKSQNKGKLEISYSDYYTHSGFYSNMWWGELKAALGQRINLEGISSSVGIVAKDKQLVVPHIAVPDIRYIDWAELKRRGFKGVVFDKDNTLTAPYSLSLWPPLGSSVALCKSLFGDNIAVFSNSAGLEEYDPDGKKAKALEAAIGIKVIRHRLKKPAGTAEEIEKQFNCESSRLIMVGDRPFTDIVYGNRNGFFTILTGPLSLEKEPFVVQQVRKLEVALVHQWSTGKFDYRRI
ncbi:OLC1v1023572C1 [Oldenlandia corymbosa var. corymbosa]|uniref:OLC1v1023572C1 n=1 Tax=Oldenlandia corymbosa var. corymbosa TaxID=529605 RepID=A0AAV1C2N1_OLDCO|nr:OLC1v1023572C1 [Oldenlandia corymbosa var. corymbosa]